VGNLATAGYERKGDVIVAFLHGLKTGELKPLQLKETDAMLAQFDPPRKARCVPKKNTAVSS
jgi:hypothetical protein